MEGRRSSRESVGIGLLREFLAGGGAPAATDKVDDLELITLSEHGLSPAIPRHNVAIEFHGHAVSLHAKDFHKRHEREGSGRVAAIALFPIDLKFHFAMRLLVRFFSSACSVADDERSERRSLAPPEKRLRSG
jgi:hypothetical protein